MGKMLSRYQAQGRQLLRQGFKDKPSLQARKRSSYTEMCAISESQVLIGLALHLELIGISKLILIPIG